MTCLRGQVAKISGANALFVSEIDSVNVYGDLNLIGGKYTLIFES